MASQIIGLFKQNKENIKAPRHWPLWGEFTSDRYFPLTKAQYCGKRFQFDDVIKYTPRRFSMPFLICPLKYTRLLCPCLSRLGNHQQLGNFRLYCGRISNDGTTILTWHLQILISFPDNEVIIFIFYHYYTIATKYQAQILKPLGRKQRKWQPHCYFFFSQRSYDCLTVAYKCHSFGKDLLWSYRKVNTDLSWACLRCLPTS